MNANGQFIFFIFFVFFRLLAQTSLRNILGTKNLHEILSDRESISIAMQVKNICNHSRGGISVGAVLTPKSASFDTFNPIFSIFIHEFANFCNLYPQKVQILTIFSKKSAILDNFPFLKEKNMGKFFSQFFHQPGKNRFFGRIFTYVCNMKFKRY